MAGRITELLAITTLATAVTAVIAVSVLRAPSERVFGMAIVGRHHDPFTVMAQFDGTPRPPMYWQPVTDVPGGFIARVAGGVAAYNWMVLLSFPLAAAATFLLARRLSLSPAGATLAAMAFAFSPFHVAQAAYHPHIAQVQWMPLYLWALWECLDRASAKATTFLIAATAAVTLSNFYGGLIAATITPAAVIVYWLTGPRTTRRWRDLALTVSALALAAIAGVAYVLRLAPGLVANRAAFAFPPGDLLRYSATAWSFLTPPVAHPFFGAAAKRFWETAGVREGLLEQQVFLGWSLIALALVAIGRWLMRRQETNQSTSGAVVPAVAHVPVLVSVGAVALFFATAPPAWLYHALPMFRSYARFAVVVQLMAALSGGIGFEILRRAATWRARALAAALAVLIVGEYAVSPRAMSRDVLPTTAHRWVTGQTEAIVALDCVPFTDESESIPRLSGQRIVIAGATTDCLEPEFAEKLAATGFTHLVIRRDSAQSQWFASHATSPGLRVAETFEDSQVLAVTAPRPAIYTAAMAGFSPREQDASWSWRWMGATATWTIRSTTTAPVRASLDLELSAFHGHRRLDVRLDGQSIATLDVDEPRRAYRIGPVVVSPGDHLMTFQPLEQAAVADTAIHNGDTRALSFAIGTWHWITEGAQ